MGEISQELSDMFKRLLAAPLPVLVGQVWRNVNTLLWGDGMLLGLVKWCGLFLLVGFLARRLWDWWRGS